MAGLTPGLCPQALLHLLADLCAHRHHAAGDLHVRHCPCGLCPAHHHPAGEWGSLLDSQLSPRGPSLPWWLQHAGCQISATPALGPEQEVPGPFLEAAPWALSCPSLPSPAQGSLFCCPPLRQVLRNKGVYESVKFIQQENFWIGPSSVRPRLGMQSEQGAPVFCHPQLGGGQLPTGGPSPGET